MKNTLKTLMLIAIIAMGINLTEIKAETIGRDNSTGNDRTGSNNVTGDDYTSGSNSNSGNDYAAGNNSNT